VADHPVKMSPELVEKVSLEAMTAIPDDEGAVEIDEARDEYIAQFFAQWGADQELDALMAELKALNLPEGYANRLRTARRPKPPSLAEQGCDALDAYIYGKLDHRDKQNTYNTIRAALNRLAELEAQQ